MPEWMWFETIVLPLLGMGMGAGVLYGVYRTVNNWIERKHERELALHGGAAGSTDVENLRSRVEALEEASDRLQDLEERVDFAERVLTQQRERGELPPGA